MSTDVPLKVKSIAANVFCLFRYEKCFHKSKHIRRYTLHVMVGTIYQLMNILRVVRMYGLQGSYLEHMWGKLRVFSFELLTVQNEVPDIELAYD